MRPSCDLDVFGDLAVAGDPAVMRPIQSDDLGQQMRIAWIRLRPRRGMAFPIPCHLQWVDREHQIAGRQQRLHPRPTVGFDAHLHLIRFGRRVQMLRDQLVQGRDPCQPLWQPAPGQHPTRSVFDLDVMVGLSPIVANKQHRAPSLTY
jgi:hypothetical protein